MTERLLLSAPENVDLSLIPLTEYGLRHGLLTEDDLRRLRAESLPLLRCQAERLTGGRSSSLPAETAGALLDSVFYTVSLALKRCASPEEALTMLQQQPLDTLFAAGQKRLARKVQAARLMHDELTRSLFSTPNAFYRATLVDGIAGFFKLYRPALFAQETHITADYALIPMNLLEPALTAALLCALDGLSANALRCAPDAAERLLRGRSASDLAERFAAKSTVRRAFNPIYTAACRRLRLCSHKTIHWKSPNRNRFGLALCGLFRKVFRLDQRAQSVIEG